MKHSLAARQFMVGGDSGMVSSFRAGEMRKPGVWGFLGRLQERFGRAFRRFSGEMTTEQGSSQFAAPSVAALSLWNLRYERRALIDECRLMYADDPRVRRAVQKFAREAVRDGVTIVVKEDRGTVAVQAAATLQRMVNPVLESWLTMLLVEGDLFVQAVIAGDEIVAAKRMPASSMERNSDACDEFPEPEKAFSQVDVLTNGEVATFPVAVMKHLRWNHVDGERYGQPEVIAARRMYRLLQMLEEAQVRRRMARAPQRILWSIGNKDNAGMASEVRNFKEDNGFVTGKREMLDPTEVARDVFGNGLVDAKVIEGDQSVHEIDDVKFLQNIFAVGLPTPGALYNLDSESVNRDVLDDMRAEWLKETKAGTGQMAEAVRWLFDLALLLKGILPEAVEYSVHFSESSIESPNEIMDRTLKAYNNGHGQGLGFVWEPLITREKAVENLSELLGIEDVRGMVEALAGPTFPPSGGPIPSETEGDLSPLVPVNGGTRMRSGVGDPFRRFSGVGQSAARVGVSYGEGQDAGR